MREVIPWLVWKVAFALHQRDTTCAVAEMPTRIDLWYAEYVVREVLEAEGKTL